MSKVNTELAAIFKEMGAIYELKGGNNAFRANAYDNAARQLNNLEEDLTHYVESHKDLQELAGVGKGIAQKIQEYLQTGKITKYEEIKNDVPADFIALLDVKGFGPKTLKHLWSELSITTRNELDEALEDGRIANLKGFGQKTVDNMKKGLKMHQQLEKRILLWDALQIGEALVEAMRKLDDVKKIDLAGSLRRCKETVGDIDILVSADQKDRENIVAHFVNQEGVREVLAQGETKGSVIIEEKNRQVDLRILNDDEWGAAMQYFTGSKEHNVRIRSIAREQNMKVSEYGVFQMDDDKKVAGSSEEEVYNVLGLQWVPPEMREDLGEMELAQKGKMPELVQLSDIRGDLHMHSNWSDGANPIEDVVEYVKTNLNYDYIALTDHSRALRMANGLDEERLANQIEAVQQVNALRGEDFIKTGIEVDINPDCSIDLSDEILSKLDWVVASVHVSQERDNTDRVVAACRNPYINVIGHPTGRMIGSREPYPLDMETVLKTARETGTAMEINAQPQRMDLNDKWARYAKEQGVSLVIDTDSHIHKNFSFMRLGVAVARRAWCTKNDILNTRSWEELAKFRKKKQELLGVTA